MSTEIKKTVNVDRDMSRVMEDVLGKGDLTQLTSGERLQYLNKLCESMGLNPLTRPFEFVSLKGKLTLYAKKDATDQLRKIHKIDVYKVEKDIDPDGLLIVTAYAKDKEGREDIDVGFANLAGLRGEDKGNAILKAYTKAKRRVTLSIVGLGLLDETEVMDIPGANCKDVNGPVREAYTLVDEDGLCTEEMDSETMFAHLEHKLEQIKNLTNLAEYEEFKSRNKQTIIAYAHKHPHQASALKELFEQRKAKLLDE